MTSEEKYYRRTYNLLNDLIDTYSNGFDKKKTLNFWKDNLVEVVKNRTILEEKRDGLLLTIVISLLGINKESIENTNKFLEYNNLVVTKDHREELKDNNVKYSFLDFAKNGVIMIIILLNVLIMVHTEML